MAAKNAESLPESRMLNCCPRNCVFQALAFACEGENVCMVHEMINESGCELVILKNSVPATEFKICRHNHVTRS